MTTTTATFTLSGPQRRLIDTMIDERFAAGSDDLALWSRHTQSFTSWQRYQDAIAKLQTIPKMPPMRVERVIPAPVAVAKEEGLYRDPSTGKLYRVKKSGWDMIVSTYSITAAVKRLTVDGEVHKKGTWKRESAFTSRIWLSPRTFGFHILAEWLTTPAELVEYQYNFCSYCHRGLKDVESVLRNYGPDCAKQHGLPYGNAYKALPVREG